MLLIHPRDEECLKNMLGIESLPLILLEEVDLQTRMYHKAGPNGPIGALGLISLVRSLGLKPPRQKPESPANTDWRKYKQDGSVKVEAMFCGSWQPGVFRGFSANGMLAICMESDGYVKEVRAGIVRLAEGSADLAAANFPPKDEGPDARLAIFNRDTDKRVAHEKAVAMPWEGQNQFKEESQFKEELGKAAEAVKEAVKEKPESCDEDKAEDQKITDLAATNAAINAAEQKVVQAIVKAEIPEPPAIKTPIVAKGRIEDLPVRNRKKEQAKDAEPDPEPDIVDLDNDAENDASIDWTAIKPGHKVFLEADNDYLDARFVGPADANDAGKLIVKVSGKDRVVDPKELHLVGA